MFKINNSKVGFGGTKLCLGKFRVALQMIGSKISEDKKNKTNGDELAVLEFIVKEIYNQQAVSEEQPNKSRLVIKENAVGQRVGWSWNTKKDATGGNLISFCAAYVGVDNPQDAGEVDAAFAAGANWEEILAELMGLDKTGKPTG